MSESKQLEPGSEEYIKRCQDDPDFRAEHFGPLFGNQEYRNIAERTMQWCCNGLDECYPHIEPETSSAYLLVGMYTIVHKMEEKLKELGADDFLGLNAKPKTTGVTTFWVHHDKGSDPVSHYSAKGAAEVWAAKNQWAKGREFYVDPKLSYRYRIDKEGQPELVSFPVPEWRPV